MTLRTRTCHFCKVKYQPLQKIQKFCSTTCKDKHHTSIKTKRNQAKVQRRKPAHIKDFYKLGGFHKDTVFRKTDVRNNQGEVMYEYICGECGDTGFANVSALKKGNRSCSCSLHNQKEAYINRVKSGGKTVALKFGIARDSKRRVKQQDSASIYEIRNYQVYVFPDVASCKRAERECKKELQCSIIPKQDMSDGYTETTSVLNLSLIKKIYERNGGVLKEE